MTLYKTTKFIILALLVCALNFQLDAEATCFIKKNKTNKFSLVHHTKISFKNKTTNHRRNTKHTKIVAKKFQAYGPQNFIKDLKTTYQKDGLLLKSYNGKLKINLLEVDLKSYYIEPALPSDSFGKLANIFSIASKHNAVAAINANYFKTQGIPLGTLIIDNNWVSGPLYDRISIGIDDKNRMYMDQITYHSELYSSNPKVSKFWINTINQPRRHGCHAIIYNKFWGDKIIENQKCLNIKVEENGRISQIEHSNNMVIPENGFVISDTNNSALSQLRVNDYVICFNQATPNKWTYMKEAVSGGPCLVKNNKLYVDFKQENFRKSWTSSKIDARTAIGFNNNRHTLYLVTVEGNHSLWDLAKFMKALGANNAMNLDGGGSTSMYINDKIVTHQKNQRKIETALLILPKNDTKTATTN